MKMYLLKMVNNETVTNHYLQIIKESFSIYFDCVIVNDINSIKDKESYIFVGEVISFYKLYIKGYRKIILWLQGVIPEESYLKHNSKIRYKILSYLEKFAIVHAKMCFSVSNEMIKHYESKYRIKMKNKTYVMPCYNTKMNKKVNYLEKENIFTYVGSFAKWQCVEESIKLFKEIQKKYNDVKLFLYTSDQEQAHKLLEINGIKNWKIDYKPIEKLNDELRKVKFGFLLREDIIVNNVATPTKLCTYLANGIIPIYSDSLRGCDDILKTTKYKVCANDKLSEIDTFISSQNIGLIDEFNDIFDTLYNDNVHINQIRSYINRLNLVK